jgi:PleD family two-component response regulator
MNKYYIRVLYVNESESDAKSVRDALSKFEGARFEIIWMDSAEKSLEYLAQLPPIELILTEDILPGISGIEFIQKLKDLKYDIPIVFLTNSKDVNLAVDVMRLGAKDYLLKEDVANRIFPKSLLRIVEISRLKHELNELEIKQRRLEAMQEIIVDISEKIGQPLEQMSKIAASLEPQFTSDKGANFLKLIRDNIERMQSKLEKLQNLKEDKTVKYIRDIKMIDLS